MKSGVERLGPAIFLAGLSWLLVACGADHRVPEDQDKTGDIIETAMGALAPVDEITARRVLPGIVIEPPAGLRDMGPEVFGPNGRYYRRGLASRSGTYTVTENKVCVQLDGDTVEPFCRLMFSNNGNYVFSIRENPTNSSEITVLQSRLR